MKYEVTENCIICNTCTSFCPTGAIGRGEVHFEINQETCIGCGLCAQKCPASAIREIKD